MTVNFYKNISEKIAVNKTLTPIIENIIGNSRSQIDVLSPSLLFQYDSDFYNDLLNCNYFNIVETGRFYFMDTPTIIQNNSLIEISGKADVLYSHAEIIKENYAIVSRQEKIFNLYYPDTLINSTQNPLIQTLSFKSGFDLNPHLYINVLGGL